MKQFLYFWGISFPLFVILDAIWFSVSLERLYKPYIGHIISGHFNYFIAAIFYLLYSAGLTFLVLLPGLSSGQSLLNVAIHGFILGLVAYGAYDLTNHATIKDWPAIVTIIDMLWGASVTGIVSCLAYKLYKW
jgi:uncharacterized membrane protein